ncbi:MAG: hypothetical protein WC379_11210 [Methanoregula sp.]|jgi:hypothetical protein
MFQQVKNNRFGFAKIILLLIMSAAIALSIAPVSADTGVTIAAGGDQSYYLGEEVYFSGSNSDSDFTYLFIVNADIPGNGRKLTSPQQNVSSGNADSFDRIQTKPDKTWEYTFYTANLRLNPGRYIIYAVSQPKTKDQLNGIKSDNVSIILKKEFISAKISPSPVSKGQPFTVTGLAEGDPSVVHIWIFGDNFLYDTTVLPGPNSTSTFTAGKEISEMLPKGQSYLIVQHPMQNNQLDIVRDGDYVKNNRVNEGSSTGGTTLFRIKGAGSLQGIDAARALVAAFNDPDVDDTYTEIPFVVDDTGFRAPQAQPVAITPSQPKTQPAPLQYAPFGAIVLILGILAWCRR